MSNINSLTEFSERLASPEGLMVADDARQRLEQLQAAVEKEIANGLPQGDFSRFAKVSNALAAARKVVILAVGARGKSSREFASHN